VTNEINIEYERSMSDLQVSCCPVFSCCISKVYCTSQPGTLSHCRHATTGCGKGNSLEARSHAPENHWTIAQRLEEKKPTLLSHSLRASVLAYFSVSLARVITSISFFKHSKDTMESPFIPTSLLTTAILQSMKPLSRNLEEISTFPSWIPFSNAYVLAAPQEFALSRFVVV
jgi:hypothetical protein